MRKYLLLLLCCFGLTLSGQNELYKNYVLQYKDMAVAQMKRHGIPASITLAQALLESGAGQSRLAREGNNHFGIKAGGTWDGPTLTKDDDRRNEKFRKYSSPEESYEDHSLFLKNRAHYKSLFSLDITDYKGWAKGLKEAGYATNPRYAELLVSIIERYGLDEYDSPAPQQKSRHHRHHRVAPSIPSVAVRPALRVDKRGGHYCVTAREGDTYECIAAEMKSRADRLRKYNEAPEGSQPRAGDIVFLQKKSKSADAQYRGKLHKVAEGESLHSISQCYGVRLKSLVKANRISRRYKLEVGSVLRIP